MPNSNPIQVQKYLGGREYPATKQELYDHAKEQGAPEEVLESLATIADKTYGSPTEVTEEVSAA